MLQVLDFTQQNIIATRTNDILGMKDYDKIHPLIHNIINEGKKVRWYFEMDDCSSDSGAIVFWENGIIELNYVNLDFTHSDDIEKIAIVGSTKWEKWMRSVMKPFVKADVKYFDLANKEQAKDWIMNTVEDTESTNQNE